MECPSCGASNREDAHFCVRCGGHMAPTCPDCRAELPHEAKFCDRCGARAAPGPTAIAARTASHTPARPISFANGRYQVRDASEAGFSRVDVLPIEHDLFRLYRLFP